MMQLMSASSLFQSTLPHGERRKIFTRGAVRIKISIHAPAWGATYIISFRIGQMQISIHAPAWGATAKT